jgi:hypothetical protein
LTRNQDFDLDVHGAKFHDDSPRFFKLYQFWQGDRLTLSLDDRRASKIRLQSQTPLTIYLVKR